MKPKIFVASTSERKKFADTVVSHLSDMALCRAWDKGIFEVGGSQQASLIRSIKESDFSIIILSADDITISRGNHYFSPRDNLVFEAGASFGAIHPNRTFIIPEKDQRLKLPTDLNGFTITHSFDPEDPPDDALAGALAQIRQRVRELGSILSQEQSGSHEKLAEETIELLRSADHTVVLFGRDLSWASKYAAVIEELRSRGVSVEVFSDKDSRRSAKSNAEVLTRVGAKVHYCSRDAGIKLTLVDHGDDAVCRFLISFKERNPSPEHDDRFRYRYAVHDANSARALWLTVVRLYEALKTESLPKRRSLILGRRS